MHNRTLVVAAVAALGVAGLSSHVTAASYVVGPGTGAGVGNGDSAGTRLNIDLTNPQTLAAGTYNVTTFDAQISQAGDAEPVLFTLNSGTAGSGSETYKVLAVGTDRTFTGAGTYSFAFSTSPVVISGGQTVYEGFTNLTGPNPVDWTNGNGNTDAHYNPGGAVSIGDIIYEYAAINSGNGNGSPNGATAGSPGTNAAYELNRIYQADIKISATPEPASLGIIGMGAIGLLARRRKA